MAQYKAADRLLRLLDTQQFFQAFIFSAERPRLWKLWQEEQKKRTFRLNLDSIANYYKNRTGVAKSGNSRKIKKELPHAILLLLRAQLRELCQLCQCENHILRNFAFEVLMRQPLLLHWQTLLENSDSQWLSYCSISSWVSEQPVNLTATSYAKEKEFANDPSVQNSEISSGETSYSEKDMLSALERELKSVFPYLLLSLDDSEHYIREKFCALIASYFPHKLSQEYRNAWKNKSTEFDIEKTSPKDFYTDSCSSKLRPYLDRSALLTENQTESPKASVWSSLRYQLFQKLLHCSLADTVYQVRHIAAEEIKEHFIDLFQIQWKQLNWTKQRYFLESFNVHSAYHRKIAWEMLQYVLLCRAKKLGKGNLGECSSTDTEEHTSKQNNILEKNKEGGVDREASTNQEAQMGHADNVELELLEMKLLYFLDICGELFTLMVRSVQMSAKVSQNFFKDQTSKQRPKVVTAEAIERTLAWNFRVLCRALELKHNRFLQVWLKSGVLQAQNIALPIDTWEEEQCLETEGIASRPISKQVTVKSIGKKRSMEGYSEQFHADYWNGQPIIIGQIFAGSNSIKSFEHKAAMNFGLQTKLQEKRKKQYQGRQQSGRVANSVVMLSLSSAKDSLCQKLEQFDAHSWILLLELIEYSQDSQSLEYLSCFLLDLVQNLVERAEEGSQWHWGDLLRLFSEFVREQDVLQRKTERPAQVFAWLKLRAQSFADEAESLWQGSPQRAASYNRQFGLLLALSAWRLCVRSMPLPSNYPVLRQYVVQVHTLASKIIGSSTKTNYAHRSKQFAPILTLMLLAMPSMLRTLQGENNGETNEKHNSKRNSEIFAGERQIYRYLIDLACIPFFSSFEALRIALRRFHSASYILDLEAQLEFQQCRWQEQELAASKPKSIKKRENMRILLQPLFPKYVRSQKDYEQVCQQLLCLLLDSGHPAVLPIVLEQLHYFPKELIAQYCQLFSQYDRGLLISSCRQLLQQNERSFYQALLSLIANLGLLELGSEVRLLLQANIPSLRHKAYHCLWQLGVHKARQNYMQYRFRGLVGSVAELQRFLQKQFLEFSGTELYQVLREAQGTLRESQAWEILCHTRSQALFSPCDTAARGFEHWGGLSPSLAQIFHEVSGEQLLRSEAQPKNIFTQLGWENILQLAAESLLFQYIQVENFSEDILSSYLQVAKRWRGNNSVTLLLHITLAARLQRNSQDVAGSPETSLYSEAWKAIRWKVQEGHGLPLLLHYLYFSLHYQSFSQKDTATIDAGKENTQPTQKQGVGQILEQLSLIPLAMGMSQGNAEVRAEDSLQWCRVVDVSGVLRSEQENLRFAEKHSWVYHAEDSKFYLFCTLLHKQDLLQLRKFLNQLPSQGLHMVRNFLLTIYEPECEQTFGWSFSSLISQSPSLDDLDNAKRIKAKHRIAETDTLGNEWEQYTLWQFAKEFHQKSASTLREHCRRLCVDLLETSGYLDELVGLLYQSRRTFLGLRSSGGGILLSSTFSSFGNWLQAEAELDGQMAKALWQHQKLQILMLLALCRTEMSYVGLALFQRDTQLPLREYALAELQGLLDNAKQAAEPENDSAAGVTARSKQTEGLLGQPRHAWTEILARLNNEDVCRKDWHQAQRYLHKHPRPEGYRQTLLLEQ